MTSDDERLWGIAMRCYANRPIGPRGASHTARARVRARVSTAPRQNCWGTLRNYMRRRRRRALSPFRVDRRRKEKRSSCLCVVEEFIASGAHTHQCVSSRSARLVHSAQCLASLRNWPSPLPRLLSLQRRKKKKKTKVVGGGGKRLPLSSKTSKGERRPT